MMYYIDGRWKQNGAERRIIIRTRGNPINKVGKNEIYNNVINSRFIVARLCLGNSYRWDERQILGLLDRRRRTFITDSTIDV